jgi:PhnB protein
MSQSNPKEATIPAPAPLTPHLTVSPGSEAISFYERAFGAKAVYRQDTPDGRKVFHATLALPNGGMFMLCDEFPEMGGSPTPKGLGGSPVTLHLDLPDVDAVWKQAVKAGAREEMALADQFWGDRYGIVSDPFGHRWSLGTRKRQPSREELDAAARKHFA